MAADTPAKRYSAMNMSGPWRGLNVVPDVLIPQGERQAVMFFYSGILFGEDQDAETRLICIAGFSITPTIVATIDIERC